MAPPHILTSPIARLLLLGGICIASERFASAGGGPQNVLVIANEKSTDSLRVARYYMEKRGIPSNHLFAVRCPIAENISPRDFEKLIRLPLEQFLKNTPLAPQIDYLVVCPDVPSRVNEVEGITSALFYGFKNAPPCPPCTIPENTYNPYFMRERAFSSRLLPANMNGTKRLVTLLRAGSVESTLALIDRSVTASEHLPNGTFYLNKSPDSARNIRHVRYGEFDFHIRFLDPRPRIVYGSCFQHADILGFMDGVPQYTTNFWANVTFLPGALADHMTSYAGRFPRFEAHDPAWMWLDAGAAGSYGTVNEPCNPLQKFPDPMVFFWYARGFNLAESYWMSVANPYQGVILGDPLTAPFAQPPRTKWMEPDDGAMVSGVVTLRWQAVSAREAAPCRVSELFIDDLLTATPIEIHPTPGAVVVLTVAGYSWEYVVRDGDTLYDAATGIEKVVNSIPGAIRAKAFGDRVMLACMDPNVPAARLPYQAKVIPAPGTDGEPLEARALSSFFLSSAYPLDRLKGTEYPRGCVQISCGLKQLSVNFVWDSRTVPDGVHTLRAVVKDGTAVETQGHAQKTITVRNRAGPH